MMIKRLSTLAVITLLAFSVSADELGDLLDKHYAATGGLEKAKSVKSMRMTGTMAMQGVELPITIIQKRPNKERVEFTFQGMTGIQATDGTTAWQVMPFQGQPDPAPMPDRQAAAFNGQADIDGPLIDWKKKGHVVELLGTEEVDGVNCFKLKLVTKDGSERFVYIDGQEYLQVRADGTREIQGSEVPTETRYEDYKPVDGMMMAHTVRTVIQGAGFEQTLTIEKIEPNIEIDDAIFAMPEVKEPVVDDDAM